MFEFLIKINDKNNYYLEFNENNKNIKELANLIKSFLNNNEFKKMINNFIFIFKNRYDPKSDIFTSGRMTINSLNF